MARPSLKDIRSEEILAAYAKCISRFGLDGATQQKIASEAGVQRSILRHYLGNREQMIGSLIDYVEKRIEFELELLVDALPASGRVNTLIDILFDETSATDENTALMLQALAAASYSYPEVNTKILDWSNRFINLVEDEIRHEYPDASENQVFQTAFGIVSLHFNIDSFGQIEIPKSWWTASGDAARSLINTLENN